MAASRKRKFGVDNPFSFAPNELRRELFTIQCPLVKILHLRDAGVKVNKFYGGQMNGDVLQYVQKYLFDRQLYDLARSYAAQEGELHHRIVLGSIVPILQALVERGLLEEEVSHTVKEGIMTEIDMDSASDSDASDEEEEGASPEKTPSSAGKSWGSGGASLASSSREFILHHEDGRFLKNHQAVDVVVNVFDKAIEQAYDIERAMCASGIVDGKSAELAKREKWLTRNCWQVAFYGYVHALHNAGLGRYAAINFACMSRREWASGALVPEGILEVQEGGIFSETAFQDLLDHQAEAYKKAHGRDIPEDQRFQAEDLEARLDEATKLLHANYSADIDKKAALPAGPYLVGKVYIGQQVNDARVYPPKDPPTLGSLVLLEGLMQIALGDRVLKLQDVGAVKHLMKKNKNKVKAAVEDVWQSHNTAGMTTRLKLAGNKFA